MPSVCPAFALQQAATLVSKYHDSHFADKARHFRGTEKGPRKGQETRKRQKKDSHLSQPDPEAFKGRDSERLMKARRILYTNS